jgi:hypothetical protein
LAKDQSLEQNQSQTNASRSGGAFTFSDVFTIDLAGEQFYNSCTNEQMTASIWNVLVSFHGIYNGNKSTIVIHSGTQRFKGVGEESGLEYIGAASRNYQESYFSDGVFTTKLVYVIHAMTAGGGNNLIITETYYINVDASGNVTYQRDPVYEVRCQ